jgi:hypothetical protein
MRLLSSDLAATGKSDGDQQKVILDAMRCRPITTPAQNTGLPSG